MLTPCSLHETFSRHSQAAEGSGNAGGGRTSCHGSQPSAGDSPQGAGPLEAGLALGIKLSPRWLSAAEGGCTDQLPRCLHRGSKPPPQHQRGFACPGFYRNEKGACDNPPPPQLPQPMPSARSHRGVLTMQGPSRVWRERSDPAQRREMLNPRSAPSRVWVLPAGSHSSECLQAR